MAPERRNQIVLALLLVVLIGALYSALVPTDQNPAPSSNGNSPSGRSAGTATRVEAPDVRLEALQDERARPTAGERNLFQFGARRAPAPAASASRLPAPPPMPTGLPTAPSVPPITLKFIGVVETTEHSQTYAVLRDDRGVYHGREGDIIEGRYRILRIGAESIDLAYVDGRGRQTIRLGS
jgi:hypothetical protein